MISQTFHRRRRHRRPVGPRNAHTRIDQAREMIRLLLTANASTTNHAYAGDLCRLAEFLDLTTPAAAIGALLAAGKPRATALVQEYKDAMREKLAPATINRRLSAIRSCFRTARSVDLIDWEIHVDLLLATKYRDTRGPGRDNYRRMLAWARDQGGPIADRDLAILHLLYDRALRNSEVRRLNPSHIRLDRMPAEIDILGKARADTEVVTLAEETAAALEAHLIASPPRHPSEPVFLHNSHGSRPSRITANGLTGLVAKIGRAVGCHATPHGLRHSAITDAINMGHSLPEVQAFSRHKNLATLSKYYDTASQAATDVTASLAMHTTSPWRP